MRRPSLYALAVLLLVAASISVSCSDDDYFADLGTADERLEKRIDATGDIADEDAQAEEGNDAYRDFLEDLMELEPPAEASAPHENLVRAFSEIIDLIEEFEATGNNATDVTEAEFARTLELAEEVSAACQEIERIASARGNNLMLFCAEDDQ